MFSPNRSNSSYCEWLSNRLLVRVKSWTTDFQLGIVLKVITFSLSFTTTTKRNCSIEKAENCTYIPGGRSFSRCGVVVDLGYFMELALCDGGMTRKSYITSSITAVIFATVVFPLFLSLCAFDLSALMFSSQMVGWNIAFSPYGCGGREEQKKVRVRAVYSSRYTHR